MHPAGAGLDSGGAEVPGGREPDLLRRSGPVGLAAVPDVLLWNEYIVTILNMLLNFTTEFLYQRFVVYGKSIDSAK